MRDRIDLDRIMGRFMLLIVIGSIIGFALFGTAIAPLIPIVMLGGALLIVITVWIINDVPEAGT
jgi:hypothetical protein